MIFFLIGRRFLTVLPPLKSMGFPFLQFWAFIMNKDGEERDDPCDMGSMQKGNLSEQKRWWIPMVLSQGCWRDYSEEIHCIKCCTRWTKFLLHRCFIILDIINFCNITYPILHKFQIPHFCNFICNHNYRYHFITQIQIASFGFHSWILGGLLYNFVLICLFYLLSQNRFISTHKVLMDTLLVLV